MEKQVQRLADKVWEKTLSLPPSKRLLIGLTGIPGSGKTTLAKEVVSALNERFASSSPSQIPTSTFALSLPMDGFHHTRSHLSSLPDPILAKDRRGAAWTFDAHAYLSLIRKLREPICAESKAIKAPGFDHAVKDPVEGTYSIPACTRVVIVEGNYVALDDRKGAGRAPFAQPTSAAESGSKQNGHGESKTQDADPADDEDDLQPWFSAATLLDEIWYLHVPRDVARERLIERHVRTGVAEVEEAAAKRADENDLPNGDEILANMVEPSEVVESLEDRGWEPEGKGEVGGGLEGGMRDV